MFSFTLSKLFKSDRFTPIFSINSEGFNLNLILDLIKFLFEKYEFIKSNKLVLNLLESSLYQLLVHLIYFNTNTNLNLNLNLKNKFKLEYSNLIGKFIENFISINGKGEKINFIKFLSFELDELI